MKYKTKKTIKTIAMSVLGLAILVGGASLVSNIVEKNSADDDGLVLVNPTFSVGGLNENGKYMDVEDSIYTKDAFECKGLQIKLDFEETIDYEVFYYNEFGTFLSTSGIQSENFVANVPTDATHARIEITPDWDLLEIEDDEDQVVKWYEVSKYSSQMEIKVAEQQEIIYEDYEYTLTEGLWDSTTTLPTGEISNGNFYSIGIMTEADLPIGTKITISEGFKFRPQVWENATTMASGYQSEVIGEATYILDSDFWSKYEYMTINVSATSGTLTEANVYSALKIVVPQE